MLGAFFIATDPVSASTTPHGRLYYGLGIGVLTSVIRSWGGYPDGQIHKGDSPVKDGSHPLISRQDCFL